jgi:hypothetical protein
MRERASPLTAAAGRHFLVLDASVDPIHAVCVMAGGDGSKGWSYSIVDTQEVVNAQRTQAEC